MPYTYYLYHKPTGKHYYGVRTAKDCHPDELWVKYFSSSKIVKLLREQYGDDSFEYQIRKIFETRENALEWEMKFLTRIDASNREDWLNLCNGGKTFSTTGRIPSEEQRKKNSEALIALGDDHPSRRESWRKRMRENNPTTREDVRQKIRENHPMKDPEKRLKLRGRKRSKETKLRISEANRRRVRTEESKEKTRQSMKRYRESLKNRAAVVQSLHT